MIEFWFGLLALVHPTSRALWHSLYAIHDANSHFFKSKRIPASRNRSNTFLKFTISDVWSFSMTNISSLKQTVPSQPCNILSIVSWKWAFDTLAPNGTLVHLKTPRCVLQAVNIWLFTSSSNWLNAFDAFNLIKTTPPFSFAKISSSWYARYMILQRSIDSFLSSKSVRSVLPTVRLALALKRLAQWACLVLG